MTAMTRTEFLAGAAALAAMRPRTVFGALAPSARHANLRIGVISDIHVRARTGQFGTEHLVKALTWFRDRGVDGVVIAGDLWNRFDIHNELDYKELLQHFEKLLKLIS